MPRLPSSQFGCFFCSSLLLTLLTFLQLSDLAGDGLVIVFGVDACQFVLKGGQFLTHLSRAFLFCLSLLDLTDGILDLLVTLTQQLLGLLLGFAQNLLALSVDLCKFVLIAVDLALQRFLVLMDGLALAFPVALVTHDVLQVLVALDIVRAHDV